MNTLSTLSPELILHLMLLCGQWSTQDKLYLSQVCSKWRGVALDTSQFWSTINVRTVGDLRLLGTFVNRSGTTALRVRVERKAADLTVADRRRLNLPPSLGLEEYIREQLNPLTYTASRLVSLYLHISRVRPFEELLRGGLYFPLLETVTLDSDASLPSRNNREHVLFINWLAPAVRTMELTEVCPAEGWDDLFEQAPLLERLALHCRDLPTGTQLAAALRHLPHLKELVIVSEFCDPDIEAPPTGWNAGSNLRAVDLRLDGRNIVGFLRGFSSVVLPSIIVGPAGGVGILDPMDEFLPHVMHGLGRVVVFDIENEKTVNIRDEHANERHLKAHYPSSYRWDAVSIWRYLCDQHSAATSVLSFTLTPSNWKSYANAFTAVPPGAQAELRLSRGLWDWRASQTEELFDFDSDGEDEGGSLPMPCGQIRRIGPGHEGFEPKDELPLTRTLDRLRLAGTAVELCLRGHTVAGQVSPQESLLTGSKPSYVRYLNDWAGSEAWVLCTSCEDLSH